MNKFEQVSSDTHQMSLARGIPHPMSGGGGTGTLYSEVQCIMDNNQMRTSLNRITDRQL